MALGHHRFEWLYVTAFVSPESGETFWCPSNGVSKAFFEELLALFASETGAGTGRFIILVIDGAGWHSKPGLEVPDGLRLVYLPRYSPQLQPAERLCGGARECRGSVGFYDARFGIALPPLGLLHDVDGRILHLLLVDLLARQLFGGHVPEGRGLFVARVKSEPEQSERLARFLFDATPEQIK